MIQDQLMMLVPAVVLRASEVILFDNFANSALFSAYLSFDAVGTCRFSVFGNPFKGDVVVNR